MCLYTVEIVKLYICFICFYSMLVFFVPSPNLVVSPGEICLRIIGSILNTMFPMLHIPKHTFLLSSLLLENLGLTIDPILLFSLLSRVHVQDN